MRLDGATKAPLIVQCTEIPVGSKLLRRETPAEQGQGGEVRGVPAILEAEFGVYHTPDEFMDRAKSLQHPFDAADLVADASFRAVLATLSRGIEETEAMQQGVIDRWRRWARELQPQEDALHARMPERVSSVYKG